MVRLRVVVEYLVNEPVKNGANDSIRPELKAIPDIDPVPSRVFAEDMFPLHMDQPRRVELRKSRLVVMTFGNLGWFPVGAPKRGMDSSLMKIDKPVCPSENRSSWRT